MLQVGRKPKAKPGAEGDVWALAATSTGVPWPWRKGRWEKERDPPTWPILHKNTEDSLLKTVQEGKAITIFLVQKDKNMLYEYFICALGSK